VALLTQNKVLLKRTGGRTEVIWLCQHNGHYLDCSFTSQTRPVAMDTRRKFDLPPPTLFIFAPRRRPRAPYRITYVIVADLIIEEPLHPRRYLYVVLKHISIPMLLFTHGIYVCLLRCGLQKRAATLQCAAG
jgi:hypothetical protein